MKYCIYHIPNIKIGCSINPERRVKSQGFSEFEILGEFDNIEDASKAEIEYQKKFGYKIDNTKYSQTINIPTKEGLQKAGEGFKTYWKELQINNKEEYSRRVKIFLSAGGKKQGKIQGQKNKESGLISQLGKKMCEINNMEQTCPHCNITAKGVGYHRWHGDKCRKKS
jgi:hypothetical protein